MSENREIEIAGGGNETEGTKFYFEEKWVGRERRDVDQVGFRWGLSVDETGRCGQRAQK